MVNAAPAALAPYRVLDLTGSLGALAGRVLAGLGADVIKVERPGGDPSRARGPFFGGKPHPHRSLSWIFANAGKRGVTLDLDRPDGRDLLRGLVERSDFLVESYPPGYLESIGLGFEHLAEVNPALVMTRVTPFGQSGPYRDYRATDIVAWAMGGQMMLCGDEDRAPLRMTAPQAELLAGAHAAAGSLTAHYSRRRTGIGQQVDISMQECVTWTLMIAAQTWDIARVNPRRGGAVRRTQRQDGSIFEHRVLWPCKDGFVYWALGGGAQAGVLASTRAMAAWLADEGIPDAPVDVEWQNMSATVIDQQTYDRLSRPFLDFFARHSKRELFEGALERAIQLAPVNEIADLAATPQLEDRGYWQDIEYPYLGATLRFPGAPVKLSETPWRSPQPAPLPGEHNAEVFSELLGIDGAELEQLSRSGAV